MIYDEPFLAHLKAPHPIDFSFLVANLGIFVGLLASFKGLRFFESLVPFEWTSLVRPFPPKRLMVFFYASSFLGDFLAAFAFLARPVVPAVPSLGKNELRFSQFAFFNF